MKVQIEYLTNEKEKISVRQIKSWVERIIHKENRKLGKIEIIITSDEQLLAINRTYLNHNYFTDIITFDNNKKDIVYGNIFISIERIKENAHKYQVTIKREMYRVISHGILHLLGYNDRNEKEKYMMRKKEDKYLKWLDDN